MAMKRIIATILFSTVLGAFTCYANEPMVLKTKSDSFSYAFGSQFARHIVEMTQSLHMTDNEDYNKDIVIQGFSETLKRNELINEDSLSNIIGAYLGLMTDRTQKEYFQKTKESRKDWARKYKKYKDIGPNQSPDAPNVKLRVLEEGTGDLITMENFVLLSYEIKLEADDKVVESSKEYGGANYLFVKQLISGISQALCHLKEGAKATFLVPYELGYGSQNVSSIPPYSDLLCNVEVKKVYKNYEEYQKAMGITTISNDSDSDAVEEDNGEDYNVEDADNSDVDY